MDDTLRYDKMVEDALRGVVREALRHVEDHGLPGDHHFYISFYTDYPGVSIPSYLKEKYPEEMTIVLQYQFWGLDIGNDAFAVTLSFNDVQERLTVPFASVTSFADPAVQFGLQFHSSLDDDDDLPLDLLDDLAELEGFDDDDDDDDGDSDFPPKGKKSAKGKDGDKKDKKSSKKGVVVDLNSFRKK